MCPNEAHDSELIEVEHSDQNRSQKCTRTEEHTMFPRNENQINHLDRPSYPLNSIGSQLCCLLDDEKRCQRIAGNACCSKPIQRKMQMIKRPKLTLDETARHIYICDYHKNIIQSMRSMNKRKKKDDDDDNSVDEYSGFNNSMNYYDLDDSPVVDLSSLQVNTLRRYKRHYRIPTKPGINKSQLVEVSPLRWLPVVERCSERCLTMFDCCALFIVHSVRWSATVFIG